jgi:hypothetical protein
LKLVINHPFLLAKAAEHGHHQVPICHQAEATANHQQEAILQERLFLEAEF